MWKSTNCRLSAIHMSSVHVSWIVTWLIKKLYNKHLKRTAVIRILHNLFTRSTIDRGVAWGGDWGDKSLPEIKYKTFVTLIEQLNDYYFQYFTVYVN